MLLFVELSICDNIKIKLNELNCVYIVGEKLGNRVVR